MVGPGVGQRANLFIYMKTKHIKRQTKAEYNAIRSTLKSIQRLRKLNISNREIAIALGIPEDSPLLLE